jgi:hypothetical protein
MPELCNGFDDNCDGIVDEGCTPPCTVDAECDDGNVCTADKCDAGTCVSVAIAGCCTANAECDDGNVCTDDSCLANACAHAAVPNCCLIDADCDDGKAETTDTCVDNQCVFTPPAQPPAFPIFDACMAAKDKEMWEGANPTTDPTKATACCYLAPWCQSPTEPIGCIGWNDKGSYCAP